PDFQARWKEGETRCLSFPRFPGRVISTAWRAPFFRWLQRLTFRRVQPHPVRPVDDAHLTIQMLADRHPTTRQRPTPGDTFELPYPLAHLHRVVVGHHALLLHGKDAVQVLAVHRHKSVSPLRRPAPQTYGS